ncbi:MAG: tetratricopeptide repeat protein [Myxococcota bacterium]
MSPAPTRAFALLLALGLAGAGCVGGAAERLGIPDRDPGDGERRAAVERRLEAEGPSADLYAEMAALRLAAEQPTAAQALVTRSLALEPDHVGALVVAARVTVARDDLATAAQRYRRAADEDEDAVDVIAEEWSQVLLRMARRHAGAGRARSALETLALLEERLPGVARAEREARAEIALRIADGLVARAGAEDALRAVNLARRAGADADALRWTGGRARFVAGEREDAVEMLEAWADEGDRAERHARLGRFYADHDAAERALEAHRRAVALDGSLESAWRGLAQVALHLQLPEDAARAHRRLASLDDDPEARSKRLQEGAEALRAAGYRGPARSLFREALELDPDRWGLVEAYGDYLGHIGDRAGLAQLVGGWLERRGRTAEAARRAAGLLAGAGAFDRAVSLLESAVERPGAEPAILLELARVLDRRRSMVARRNRAVEAYLERAGDDPDAVVRAGRTWLRFRERDRALAAARRALSIAPRHLEAALLRADALRALGRAADERQALAGAVSRAEDRSRAALLVGRRHLGHGDAEAAVRWLEDALRRGDAETRREAHEALFQAHLRTRPPDDRAAARHMREWLRATPDEERTAGLEDLLPRTGRTGALARLRIEVLEALVERKPDDPALTDELGGLHLRAGSYERARQVWERHLVRADDPRRSAVRIGEDFLDHGRIEQALAFFDRVEPAVIRQPNLLRRLGTIHARRGEPARARHHFELFLERTAEGEHRRELAAFASEMTTLRHHDLAVQAWRRILDDHADDRDAMHGLGTALLRMGRDEEARKWLDRYLEATPPSQRRQALQKVGDTWEKEGRLSEAARVYEAWLEEERPGWGNASFARLAHVRKRMGDREGLLRAARLLIDRSRSAVRSSLDAADRLEEAGLAEAAAGILEEALSEQRSSRNLLQAAVDNALRRRDLEEARDLLERLVRVRGAAAEAWRDAAETLVQAGDPEGALALLDESGARGADAAPLHVLRGRILLSLGDYDAADEQFARALTAAVSGRDVVERVDAAYRAFEQHSRLQRFHARASALAPKRAEHHLALGGLALEEGDDDEANRALTRYLTLDERGHLEVARAWARAGRVERALKHYERAWERPGPGRGDLPLDEVATLLVDHGRAGELEAFARQHVRQARDEQMALRSVVEAWRTAGDPAAALRWLDRARALRTDPKLELQRGELLVRVGRLEAAREAFARYVDLSVAEPSPHRRLRASRQTRQVDDATDEVVGRWLRTRRVDEALEHVRWARGAYGDGAHLAVTEAWLHVMDGDVEAALRRLRPVEADLGSAPRESLGRLIQALVVRERLDEAVRVLDEALAGHHDDELAVVRLRLQVRLGRLAEADRRAAGLVAASGPDMTVEVGRAAFREGHYTLARRWLEEALEVRPPARPDLALRLLAAIDALEEGGAGERRGGVRALPESEDRLETLRRRAERAFFSGDFAAAREAARTSLDLSPGDPEMLRMLVISLGMLGDRAGVEQLVERIRIPGRSRLDALDALRRWLDDSGHPGLALLPLEAGLALQGGDPDRWREGVVLALQAGRDEQAARYAEGVLSRSGGEPGVALSLASTWARWLVPQQASEVLEAVPQTGGPADARKARVEARAALAAGRTDAAVEALERSVAAAPDPIAAREAAAAALLTWEVAPSAAYDLVVPEGEAAPVSPRTLALAARAAWRAGEAEAARRWFRRLRERHPTRDDALGGLLRAAVAGGDEEGTSAVVDAFVTASGQGTDAVAAAAGLVAESLFRHAEDLGPARVAPLADLAEVLLARAREVAALSPSNLAGMLATVEEARGDVAAALEAHEAAMMWEPGSSTHVNNLAYVLARHGRNLERALGLVREALLRAGEPVPGSFLDTEAWVLHRMGRSEEALPVMGRALLHVMERERVAPAEMTEILHHLAEIRAAVGDRAGARAAWRDCARRDPGGGYGAACLERLRGGGEARTR